jgi:hypothetical protein
VATHSVRDELIRSLERLSPEKQRELLLYACSLADSSLPLKGTPGENLVTFGGVIEPGDLRKIASTIEEDCENVDPSAW